MFWGMFGGMVGSVLGGDAAVAAVDLSTLKVG